MTSRFHRVFVYGTLKRGEPNHFWLQNKENGFSRFLTCGSTSKKYPLVIGTKYNIPFLLDCPGKGHNVLGEVFEVDNEMLRNLDVLEEHPNYYLRRLEKINGSNNFVEMCWTYFLPRFGNDLLSKEMLQNYNSNGPHNLKYCEKYLRDPFFDYKHQTVE